MCGYVEGKPPSVGDRHFGKNTTQQTDVNKHILTCCFLQLKNTRVIRVAPESERQKEATVPYELF